MAKSIQYINIIKEDRHLKIHSQVLQKNIAISNNLQTISLPNKNKITNEAITNIKSEIKKVKNTKIALLCDQVHQKALANHLWVNYQKNTTYLLDSKHKAITSKVYINSLIQSYKDIKIDFIYSPYSILYNIVPNDYCDKTLYALIVNDIIYMVIFKQDKIAIMSRTNKLISFSEVEESHFYKNDMQKQLLFSQLYALELENAISSFVDDWYIATNHHQKLQKVIIACNVKQLSNEEINNIKNNIGFIVQYEHIDINEYMLALNMVPNIQSFIAKTKPKFFSHFSLSGMINAYYHIKESNRTKGYILACLGGIIVYRTSPDIATQITNFITKLFDFTLVF